MRDFRRFMPRVPERPSTPQLGSGKSGSEAGPTGLTLRDVVQEYAAPVRGPLRCLLLFDATGSMSPYWDHVRATIREVIDRLLAAGGAPQLKIVAYRDDCDGDRILEGSRWCGDAGTLRRFLRHITCDGGGDTPEAVDRALQVAVQEQGNISAVVLIGDAPPHANREGVAEARQLAQQQRPVYAIPVGNAQAARAAFEQIARLSGGQLLELDRLETLYELLGILLAHSLGERVFEKYLAQHERQLSEGTRAAVRMLTTGRDPKS